MNIVENTIEELATRYKYRPLPRKVRQSAHDLYNQNLNGFDIPRDCIINKTRFCIGYNRVVVGDYGAYLEVDPEFIRVDLNVATGQSWRLNQAYLLEKNLNIKYKWFEYMGHKVYLQVNTVKYADYLPGKYYIAVTAFDKLNKV